MKVLNARDEVCGHRCSARDPRLAVQIASRYPGVCEHSGWLEWEVFDGSTEIKSEIGKSLLGHYRAAHESVAKEPAPGAKRVTNLELLEGLAAMPGRDGDAPPVVFIEPVGATLDTYTLLGTPSLRYLPEATLLRVDPGIAAALAANVTFPDAITAIRAADPDRLPLWIDFTDDEGEPLRLRRGSGPPQPLYGVMILDYAGEDDVAYDDELPEDDIDGSARVVAPFGRTAGLIERPFALCALGVGPDDNWRYPIPANKISLITAHRGGVQVEHVRTEHDFIGTEPPITSAELGREISGHVARTTEWILARVGAILSGLDDGLLLMDKVGGSRTFQLVTAPQTRGPRDRRALDASHIVARLRELGSLRRVAQAENVDIVSIHEELARAGVDPDQVRRDEVIRRFRRAGSVDVVVGELHLFRSEVERFLTEAGVDFTTTPVPHDVTDPDVLAAITAYQEHGTFGAAGDALGVSGETVRRRLARAGMNADDVLTDPQRRAVQEAVKAWEAEGRSLAGAARRLALDPRTVKDRLRQAGVSAAAAGTAAERAAEARHLFNVVGSAPQVAALMGVSTSTVRRYLGEASGTKPRRGRPPVSDDALVQVELALEEHGSIRAAARALGMSVGGFSHRLKLARARHEAAPASQSKDGAMPGPAKAKEK
jgi:DNA invertase Pin-like site-specific DNA recombinase